MDAAGCSIAKWGNISEHLMCIECSLFSVLFDPQIGKPQRVMQDVHAKLLRLLLTWLDHWATASKLGGHLQSRK